MTDTERRPAPSAPPSAPEPPPAYETGGLRLVLLIAAVAAAGLALGWPALVVILGIVVMIFLHELGHYLTAKWAGMKVTEFFIGFGPRIWSFRRGETEYGLKVVPAGAYVRIIGMNNLDEVDPADEPRTYREKSFPKRLLVVSAGSLMHFAQAFVLLVVLLGVVGFPGRSIANPPDRAPAWEIDSVVADSAAQEAGLRENDLIVGVDGQPVSRYDDLSVALSRAGVGEDVQLTIERDGVERTIDARLRPRPADQGGETGSPFLGVGTSKHFSDQPIGLGTAIVRAPGEMARFTGQSFGALAGFFSPRGISDFANNVGEANNPDNSGSGSGGGSGSSADDNDRLISIIGVIQLGSQDVENRAAFLLALFFSLNMFIGIFNMLPLLPLDGGHAAIAVYERVRSRAGRAYHADFAKLLPLTYAVVMGLVLLGVTAMYLDIVNPISG
ncbi:MAG TPA: site-2 protease family protein [Acidimicrobiales bacterium]|nr:site-2 protease family protein [Acidimicrobiales bacterium]